MLKSVGRVCAVTGFLLTAAPGVEGQDPAYQVRNGLVVVEAEDFVLQTVDDVRRWYLVNASNDGLDLIHIPPGTPQLPARPEPDGDRRHATRAVGGTYVEILPDTRRTDEDPIIAGVSFSNSPGVMAILSYDLIFDHPGRYYVWVRAYSTGTEDNGVHVGLDGEWPASGRRMQWCNGKNAW